MTTQTYTIYRHDLTEVDWQARYLAFVHAGKARYSVLFEGNEGSFDDNLWEIGFLRSRTVIQARLNLKFYRRNNTTEPLPKIFCNVVKSWLLLSKTSPEYMANRLDCVKILWEVLLIRGHTADNFHWSKLCEEDIRQAELMMLDLWTKETVQNRIPCLTKMIQFLSNYLVCPPFHYKPITGKRFKTGSLEELNSRRKTKLPSKRSLEGLARVYSELATDPEDRARIAAIALLAVTGFRIGELLSLPLDCLVMEKDRNGNEVTGIRYYVEKVRGGAYAAGIRWLSPVQAELARQAIDEIKQLTASAREQAKVLEKNPERVEIPGLDAEDLLDVEEAAQAVGLTVHAVWNWGKLGAVGKYKKGRRFLYKVADIQQYLHSLREKTWTLNRRDGTYQVLSESLFVFHKNFFHKGGGFYKQLVMPLRFSHMQRFLLTMTSSKSIFERFDIREDDGTFCGLTTHQFRHWLNDLADKGGMPIDSLTRWMGRTNPEQTNAYRHATMDERLEWVKAGIRNSDIGGIISEVYFELPEVERDVFLETQIQAVHYTSLGLCVHDFAIDPCEYHLNCLRGCHHYLRQKGNEKERIHLLQVQANTEKALEAARQHSPTTMTNTWIEHHEGTLRGVAAALAVDEDMNQDTGNLIRPSSIEVIVSPGG